MERASYSRVNSILACPKKYNEVPFETNPHFQTGLVFHDQLETYIKTGYIDPVISEIMDSDFLPMIVDKLNIQGHERIISEYELLTDEFKGYIDLVIIDDVQKCVIIGDLKTVSKTRVKAYTLDDAEQMRLYAYYFILLNPSFVEAGYTIHIAYLIYIKNYVKSASTPEKVIFDVQQVTASELNQTAVNFNIKTAVARVIINNGLWYANKNEYCNMCSIKERCKGLK